MTSFGASEADATLFPPHMVKSDDPVVFQQQHQNQNVACQSRKGRIYTAIKFWNIFDDSPEVPPWRVRLGVLLTLLHLAGVIVIIVLYYISSAGAGRPIVVDTEFVSPQRVMNDTALTGYVCNCDLPAGIKDAENLVSETFNRSLVSKAFNRCYEPEELKGLDVLQFGSYEYVEEVIEKINTKPTTKRTFQDGYRLEWESYELMTSTLENSTLDNVTDLGYIGKPGFITVKDLADLPFFTVPQGFIKAGIDYDCTTCGGCRVLWAKYNFIEATRQVSQYAQDEDVGWIYCYESSPGPPDSSDCRGSCRFFRTYYKPWGIEMYNIATELKNYTSDDSIIYFQSHFLYANVSRFYDVRDYQLSFLEIERDGTSWAELFRYYNDIPACAENSKNEVVICNGTSICELASIYSHDDLNSEVLKAVCINTAEDFQIDQQTCKKWIEDRDIKTQNESVLASVCGAFKCKKVRAEQVHWDNYFLLQGEVALSRLTWEPALITSYTPALCSNNYSGVYVQYDEVEDEISAIYQTSCIQSKSDSKGCWLTGKYKHMNATLNDPWEVHEFSDQEVKSNETMFACYRFNKESYHSYLYDEIGAVAGIIGSWLLLLSCIFWTSIRTFPQKLHSNPPLSSTRSDTLELVRSAWSRSQSLEDADRRSIDMFLRQP